MTLANQSTARVHHPLPSVRHVAGLKQLTALALATETQCFVGDQLVAAEAIVQFDHLHSLRPFACLSVDFFRARLGHGEPHCVDTGSFMQVVRIKRLPSISSHALSNDLDSLALQPVLFDGLLTHENHRCCAVACGATLQLGQRVIHLGCPLNLLQCVHIPELRVWVVGRVAVVLLAYHRKMLRSGTVLRHMILPCVAKKIRHQGHWLLHGILAQHHRQMQIH
mmetsp:Transcript_93463/g.250352  ORF Transcript_93463/g.250352 Transcript_93463/m.250352 type:complete len:223 (-) Transcript_93463:418-1086(-)